MTKIKLWAIYVSKNPKFEEVDATVTFTQEGLKKFFDQTFNQGFKEGQETMAKLKESSNPFDSIFDGLFKTK